MPFGQVFAQAYTGSLNREAEKKALADKLDFEKESLSEKLFQEKLLFEMREGRERNEFKVAMEKKDAEMEATKRYQNMQTAIAMRNLRLNEGEAVAKNFVKVTDENREELKGWGTLTAKEVGRLIGSENVPEGEWAPLALVGLAKQLSNQKAKEDLVNKPIEEANKLVTDIAALPPLKFIPRPQSDYVQGENPGFFSKLMTALPRTLDYVSGGNAFGVRKASDILEPRGEGHVTTKPGVDIDPVSAAIRINRIAELSDAAQLLILRQKNANALGPLVSLRQLLGETIDMTQGLELPSGVIDSRAINAAKRLQNEWQNFSGKKTAMVRQEMAKVSISEDYKDKEDMRNSRLQELNSMISLENLRQEFYNLPQQAFMNANKGGDNTYQRY